MRGEGQRKFVDGLVCEYLDRQESGSQNQLYGLGAKKAENRFDKVVGRLPGVDFARWYTRKLRRLREDEIAINAWNP